MCQWKSHKSGVTNKYYYLIGAVECGDLLSRVADRRQSIRENTAIGCYRNRAFTIARAPVKKLQIYHVTAYENLIHDDKAPSQYVTVAESELRYLYYGCISRCLTVNE